MFIVLVHMVLVLAYLYVTRERERERWQGARQRFQMVFAMQNSFEGH